MGRKRTPGLVKRGKVWHIAKKIGGQRICESTGTSNLEEAEKILAHRCEEIRQLKYFGIKPNKSFREAATKYLQTNQHKASLDVDARNIRYLDQYIGDLPLTAVHMGTLEAYIEQRKKDGVKNRTINHGLQITRRILNLAASEWRDDDGQPWLGSAPKIKVLPEIDKRDPYPLEWEEQERLFKELPEHLEQMSLFAVNTGCRDGEICKLRWQWEVPIPELGTSVFVLPRGICKNRCGHVVVLNSIAYSVINAQRGRHPTYVFTYRGNPIGRINNTGWDNACELAGLRGKARVHDLRHTYGRRLRASGVSLEDRQDLLGHKSCRITTHYSTAELKNLLIAAEKVCQRSADSTLALIKCVGNYNAYEG